MFLCGGRHFSRLRFSHSAPKIAGTNNYFVTCECAPIILALSNWPNCLCVCVRKTEAFRSNVRNNKQNKRHAHHSKNSQRLAVRMLTHIVSVSAEWFCSRFPQDMGYHCRCVSVSFSFYLYPRCCDRLCCAIPYEIDRNRPNDRFVLNCFCQHEEQSWFIAHCLRGSIRATERQKSVPIDTKFPRFFRSVCSFRPYFCNKIFAKHTKPAVVIVVGCCFCTRKWAKNCSNIVNVKIPDYLATACK